MGSDTAGAAMAPLRGRSQPLAELIESVESRSRSDRVINLYGTGGIGKSRLLNELKMIGSQQPSRLVARLEFLVERHLDPVDALKELRRAWGGAADHLVHFDLVLAASLARQNSGDPHQLFVELARDTESKVLGSLVEGLAAVVDGVLLGLPLATKTVTGLLRVVGDKANLTKDEIRTLEAFDDLDIGQLQSAALRLLAEGVTRSGQPSLLLLDDVDVLEKQGGTSAWVRTLISQLPDTVVVVTSADPLDWDSISDYWDENVRLVEIDELAEDPARQVLIDRGVEDESYRSHHAAEGRRNPLYLHLAADGYAAGNRGDRLDLESLETQTLQHLTEPIKRHLRILALASQFDADLYERVTATDQGRRAFHHFVELSAIVGGPQLYRVHSLLADALTQNLLQNRALADSHSLLFDYWREQVDFEADLGSSDLVVLHEAAIHGLASGRLDLTDGLQFDAAIAHVGRPPARRTLSRDLSLAATRLHHVRAHRDVATEIRRFSRLLFAEAAASVADTTALDELDFATPAGSPSDEIEARYWVAVGDLLRISGRPPEDAIRFYQAVYEGRSGETALEAGHWVADLEMAQGKIRVGPATCRSDRTAD